MNKIEQRIGDIEEFIEQCRPSAFSSSRITVQKEDLEAMLVDLRMAIPDEVTQSQKIITNQRAIMADAENQANQIIADARAKADAMLAEAQRMKEQMVDEHEIMQQALKDAETTRAQARADGQQIIEDATRQANDLLMGAYSYVDGQFAAVQEAISHTIGEAKRSFENLNSTLSSNYSLVTGNRNALQNSISGGQDNGPDVLV